ncbi:hypothetical protein F5Y16DRAFT_378943 [Xylariaceae sp. FL0255]|nr:hypothetical protein F5Y16DRAFT_378943 [Xylariaceae sp. FL0255]
MSGTIVTAASAFISTWLPWVRGHSADCEPTKDARVKAPTGTWTHLPRAIINFPRSTLLLVAPRSPFDHPSHVPTTTTRPSQENNAETSKQEEEKEHIEDMSRGGNGVACGQTASQQQQPQSVADADAENMGVRRLASLPDEVLTQIFETVGSVSRQDLCSVSLVSKGWHDLADAVLYQRVRFGKPEHHLAFGESLTRRVRRGSAIHFASLQYPNSELAHLSLNGHIANSHYTPAHFDSLSRTISTMSNLEELEISVPETLLHGIGALFNGPFDLACLKSCSLYYQCPDNAYWDLRENIHIFAHPTLETLYIRRAKLDYRGFDFIERPHELPLKKLHLIECDISDDALGDVLELPKALEEFVMTQSAEPTPDLEESSDNIGDYISALSSQCESLQSITIDFPTMGSRRPLKMRDFVALKIFRLNWDWQLFGKKSKKPRLDSVGIPPNLELLEFFNELGTDDEITELLDYLMQTDKIAARAIKTEWTIDSINDRLAHTASLIPPKARAYSLTVQVD